MGSALSSRVEWTSASDSGGKLDFSRSNESFLQEVIKYIEDVVREHHHESEVTFKSPFVWKTSLGISSFDSLKSPEYIISEDGVVSTDEVKDGEPALNIKKTSDAVEIKVWSLKYLVRVLSCARERKIKEAQLCLEANNDPISCILGPAFSNIGSSTGKSNTLLEIHERLAREKARGNESTSVDELDSGFRLLLLINSLDLQLMKSSVKQLGREVRLTPETVNHEVELLQSFSGENIENSCLKTIEFTSSLVFSNGCRAPPWRQILGDILYINIHPWDSDPVCVTASTEGYFLNKGMSGDTIIYDRVGEVYSSLVSLLKTISTQFSDNVNKQEFSYHDEATDNGDDDLYITAPEPKDDETQQEQQTTPIKHKEILKPFEKNIHKPVSRNKRTPRTKDMFPTTKETPLTIGSKRSGLDTQQSNKMKSSSSIRSNKGSVPLEEDSESSESGSEEEEIQDRRPESTADLPSEYWQIQKLMKYLKGGNQTATVIALCSLSDFDLTQESSHLAIRDNGGLDLLINLLETDDIKCKIGTLRILRDISTNSQTRSAIVDLKGLPQLVSILSSTNRELKCLAAQTIANTAKFRRARRIVRNHGGLQYLVNMLENPGRPGSPISGQRTDLEVSRCAALGLWSCSSSRKNKLALLKTNVVSLLGKLLQSNDEDVLIPVVGTLQECASEPIYQALIQYEGMVEHLVKGLHLDNTELKMHCAAAIFKCAEDEKTREHVLQFNGLEPLTKLLTINDNKELLTAATGAIWKCSKSPSVVKQLKALKTVDKLVALISNQPEEVQVNVVGALGECAAQDTDNRVAIRKAGGVTPLIQLLTGTNQALLINSTKAVGACALDNECMTVIDKQDGVRLLWSLLKSPNPEVQACAAWSICPCIQNAKDSGELVRSFVGGLELIVGLLKSDDVEVLASVCAAIAKIALDEENLAVITDHGVVSMLAKLTNTSNDKLRHHLADAIAKCCSWRNNRIGFGQNNSVAPLVEYLRSTDSSVHQTTACALHQLSKDPDNCITMHGAGVVQLLLPMIGSKDEILQEASAGCISNIRHLALANEKAKYQ